MTEPLRLDYTLIAEPGFSNVNVYYVYTAQEEEARREILALIDQEKRVYLAKVEPLLKRLGTIQGTPRYIVQR